MPYICKLLPKWWNFSKSGHTGKDLPKRVLTKESVSAPLWGANLNHWMAYKTNLLKSHSCQSKTVWPNGLIICTIFGHLQQWNSPNSINILQKWVKCFSKLYQQRRKAAQRFVGSIFGKPGQTKPYSIKYQGLLSR